MLPDAQHRPPRFGESAICIRVAGSVLLHLLRPVGAVSDRHGVMLGAAVPETAVQENRDLGASEHQIGGATQTRHRASRHAIPQAERVYRTPQGQFGPSISTSIGLHAGPRTR